MAHSSDRQISVLRRIRENIIALTNHSAPASSTEKKAVAEKVTAPTGGSVQLPETMHFPLYRDIWISASIWEKVLPAFFHPLVRSMDLENAIKSYNSTRETFDVLHSYAREFPADFHDTLPFIVKIALLLPDLFDGSSPENLSTALSGEASSWTIRLNQWQSTCLVANAFLCTFPETRRSTYPYFSFRRIFSSKGSRESPKMKMEKVKFIFNFFKQRKQLLSTKEAGKDVITYERRRFDQDVDFSTCQMKLAKCTFQMGKIDDEETALQMDFANKYVGGGVLVGGCVQEEIRFITCPDLIAGMAFTEVLGDRDVFIVDGATQTSNYDGYSFQLSCSSQRNYSRPFKIVAADALPFFSNPTAQYLPQNIRRELIKATCAFWNWNNEHPVPAVATGNWGCGAFRGDPVLKFFIQLLAASVANRPLVYAVFHEPNLEKALSFLYLKSIQLFPNVAVLYAWLLEACELCLSSGNDFLSCFKRGFLTNGNNNN